MDLIHLIFTLTIKLVFALENWMHLILHINRIRHLNNFYFQYTSFTYWLLMVWTHYVWYIPLRQSLFYRSSLMITSIYGSPSGGRWKWVRDTKNTTRKKWTQEKKTTSSSQSWCNIDVFHFHVFRQATCWAILVLVVAAVSERYFTLDFGGFV